jgi:hypothetical protein
MQPNALPHLRCRRKGQQGTPAATSSYSSTWSVRSRCRNGKVAWTERVLLRQRHGDGPYRHGDLQRLLRAGGERDRSELVGKPVIVSGAQCRQAIYVAR